MIDAYREDVLFHLELDERRALLTEDWSMLAELPPAATWTIAAGLAGRGLVRVGLWLQLRDHLPASRPTPSAYAGARR